MKKKIIACFLMFTLLLSQAFMTVAFADAENNYVNLGNGYSRIEENSKFGLRCDNEVIIEPKYDEIVKLNDYTYKTRLSDKYGVIYGGLSTHKIVSEPKYDEIEQLDNYFKTKLGDKYGLIFYDEVITEPKYDEIVRFDDYFKTRLGDKYGLISYDEVITEPKYDDVIRIGRNEQVKFTLNPFFDTNKIEAYFVAKDEKGIGAYSIDNAGKIIIQPNIKYEDVKIENDVLYAKVNGEWKSINKLQAGVTHLKNGTAMLTGATIMLIEAPFIILYFPFAFTFPTD